MCSKLYKSLTSYLEQHTEVLQSCAWFCSWLLQIYFLFFLTHKLLNTSTSYVLSILRISMPPGLCICSSFYLEHSSSRCSWSLLLTSGHLFCEAFPEHSKWNTNPSITVSLCYFTFLNNTYFLIIICLLFVLFLFVHWYVQESRSS